MKNFIKVALLLCAIVLFNQGFAQDPSRRFECKCKLADGYSYPKGVKPTDQAGNPAPKRAGEVVVQTPDNFWLWVEMDTAAARNRSDNGGCWLPPRSWSAFELLADNFIAWENPLYPWECGNTVKRHYWYQETQDEVVVLPEPEPDDEPPVIWQQEKAERKPKTFNVNVVINDPIVHNKVGEVHLNRTVIPVKTVIPCDQSQALVMPTVTPYQYPSTSIQRDLYVDAGIGAGPQVIQTLPNRIVVEPLPGDVFINERVFVNQQAAFCPPPIQAPIGGCGPGPIWNNPPQVWSQPPVWSNPPPVYNPTPGVDVGRPWSNEGVSGNNGTPYSALGVSTGPTNMSSMTSSQWAASASPGGHGSSGSFSGSSGGGPASLGSAF